jgi:hypothetical protein
MDTRHGAAIAGVIAVLAAVVLLVVWPGAGHPDDARLDVDAGTALAPAVEPAAPEEPSPVVPAVSPSVSALPPPPSSPPTFPVAAQLGAPPPSGLAAPPAPIETRASPRFTTDEAYDAANTLVSAIEARRAEIETQLADATRRGDARMIARLTQQRDGLSASLTRAQGLLADMDHDRAASATPTPTPVDEPPADELDIPPGP